MLPKDEQYKVFIYYVGSNFKLGYAYLSPLPKEVRGTKDRFSSFNIYEDGDKLKWKDFGAGGEFGGDALDFIQVMERNVNDVKQAYRFYLKNIKNNNIIKDKLVLEQSQRHKKFISSKKDPIVHYTDKFTPSELAFWTGHPFHVSIKRLLRKRIYSLEGIDWGDGLVSYREGDKPCFVFDLSERGDMSVWKMYNPFAEDQKRNKWKSWNLHKIPFEDYYLLPEKMETFILCSGKKDSIITEVCFDDKVNCGSPTAEGSYRSLLPHVPEINSRAKNKFILFDGDKAGIKAANDLSEMTGWKPIIFDYPIKTGLRYHTAIKLKLPLRTKDVSEIVDNYSYRKLYKIISNEIYN